jgi:hypothetical protein
MKNSNDTIGNRSRDLRFVAQWQDNVTLGYTSITSRSLLDRISVPVMWMLLLSVNGTVFAVIFRIS